MTDEEFETESRRLLSIAYDAMAPRMDRDSEDYNPTDAIFHAMDAVEFRSDGGIGRENKLHLIATAYWCHTVNFSEGTDGIEPYCIAGAELAELIACFAMKACDEAILGRSLPGAETDEEHDLVEQKMPRWVLFQWSESPYERESE